MSADEEFHLSLRLHDVFVDHGWVHIPAGPLDYYTERTSERFPLVICRRNPFVVELQIDSDRQASFDHQVPAEIIVAAANAARRPTGDRKNPVGSMA